MFLPHGDRGLCIANRQLVIGIVYSEMFFGKFQDNISGAEGSIVLLCSELRELEYMFDTSDKTKFDPWLRNLHIGVSHASNGEMIELLKNVGGMRPELLQRVKDFECAICKQLAAPQSHHVSSKHTVMHFNSQVMMDLFFVIVRRAGGAPKRYTI